ncbi:MAG: rubrerythrin family protein [Clostridium butyricum]|nr:rubrerythrin family protein [Clostridium butyricum]
MDFKNSRTKTNLMRAFAGESQARNRYDMAAEIAKTQKYNILERLFKYTASQEQAHAKVFYDALKALNGEEIVIDNGAYPVEAYDDVAQLLKASSQNEYKEHDVVYKEFADIAEEEGFSDIAEIFRKIASIEKVHGDRFKRYADEFENGSLFKKDESTKWFCTNCGFIYEGKEAPNVCPVCKKPQGYYLLFENSLFE